MRREEAFLAKQQAHAQLAEKLEDERKREKRALLVREQEAAKAMLASLRK